MIAIIMGVSGSGKTTVGTLLASRTGWTFVEADDFHPPENIARMTAGIALTDDDRRPWLQALAARIREARERHEDIVLACSALRRTYRDLLTDDQHEDVLLVWLTGTAELLEERMRQREHFMPAELLRSQLATLEPPDADEHALELSIEGPPEKLVEQIMTALPDGGRA